MRTKHGVLLGALLGAATMVVGDTADAKECGSYPRYWNAPAGAAVFSEGADLIRDIMVAIGEKWTHNILSDGSANGYHSTAAPVGDPWDFAYGDLIEPQLIQKGAPGPSKARVGALQHFYGSQIDLGWIAGGSAGSSARDWIRSRPTCNFDSSSGQSEQICKRSHGDGLYSYGVWTNLWYGGDCCPDDDPDTWCPCYGYDLWYQLDQYKHNHNTHNGSVYYPGDYYADGMVCSTWAAYLLKRGANRTVSPYTYSASKVYNAAHMLHDSVELDCEAASGGFFNCNRIANQVVNCFCSFDHCDDNSNYWQGSCDSTSAVSVSPDRLAGRNHTGTNSPYAGRAINNVTFSGSSQYGCWEKPGS